MKSTQILSAVAMAAVMTLAVSSAQAATPAMEKCYGVVKAGKNDCKSTAHSCAGHAAKDGSGTEFIQVPAGLCDKLVGGITKEASEDKMMSK